MSHVFLLKIIFPKIMMSDYKDISCISYISIKLELIFPMIEHTRCITIITIMILMYNRDISSTSIKNNFSKNYDE